MHQMRLLKHRGIDANTYTITASARDPAASGIAQNTQRSTDPRPGGISHPKVADSRIASLELPASAAAY